MAKGMQLCVAVTSGRVYREDNSACSGAADCQNDLKTGRNFKNTWIKRLLTEVVTPWWKWYYYGQRISAVALLLPWASAVALKLDIFIPTTLFSFGIVEMMHSMSLSQDALVSPFV